MVTEVMSTFGYAYDTLALSYTQAVKRNHFGVISFLHAKYQIDFSL